MISDAHRVVFVGLFRVRPTEIREFLCLVDEQHPRFVRLFSVLRRDSTIEEFESHGPLIESDCSQPGGRAHGGQLDTAERQHSRRSIGPRTGLPITETLATAESVSPAMVCAVEFGITWRQGKSGSQAEIREKTARPLLRDRLWCGMIRLYADDCGLIVQLV